jgi:hypothetical protein
MLRLFKTSTQRGAGFLIWEIFMQKNSLNKFNQNQSSHTKINAITLDIVVTYIPHPAKPKI